MFPAASGYDRAITVFSPDGRLYQVEYAIETVRRGSLALGIKSSEGSLLAVEEKIRKLQTYGLTQKIFQVDDHIGVAAAGYIPDARIQVDQARVVAPQSNRLVYDEPIDTEILARRIADMSQQFTQFAGVRPFGVSLIISGVDRNGSNLYLTDPSGNYVAYDAVAIGAGSEQVMELFEERYDHDLKLDNAIILALEAIYQVSEDKVGVKHIKMAIIEKETGRLRRLSEEELEKHAAKVKVKGPDPDTSKTKG
jgi:proteasome alpha subunit